MGIHVGWPQAIMIVALIADAVRAAYLHGQLYHRNVWEKLADGLITGAILWWGGFFS